MELFLLASAVWLGILTSVSPCPLATNIAAVSFISQRITQKNVVFLSGILYTIGRSLTYIVLGILIVKTLVDVPILSDFLQRYVNKILGIILILVGMVLLDLLRIPLPLPSVSENVAKKLIDKGSNWFTTSGNPVCPCILSCVCRPVLRRVDSHCSKSTVRDRATLNLWYRNSSSGPALCFSCRSRHRVYQQSLLQNYKN